MYVLITCNYEKDPIKNNREKVETRKQEPRKREDFVFPIISLWEFFPMLKGS